MLRQNISVVLQDSVLFEGSIRENLEIGRPGASLEELIDACIKANIHETIANLPDGYDTNVREQGNNFSAGQRQRLAGRDRSPEAPCRHAHEDIDSYHA